MLGISIQFWIIIHLSRLFIDCLYDSGSLIVSIAHKDLSGAFMEAEKNMSYRLGSETVTRTIVPMAKRMWNVPWPEYSPASGCYNFKNAPWADLDIGNERFYPKFNDLDGNIDRRSHTGKYSIDNSGYPLNPSGRTGIKYRGILGKWGPNHAADPIVTRWKLQTESGVKILNSASEKPILQFVAIQRRDTKDWAIPGGMIDAGEQVSETLKREFMEESLNLNDLDEVEQESLKNSLKSLFLLENGIEIFKGIVDDPRNTDNAWMETIAVNFHDEIGQVFRHVPLAAGDDAQSVQWIDVDASLKLYANHKQFIEATARRLNAHW